MMKILCGFCDITLMLKIAYEQKTEKMWLFNINLMITPIVTLYLF